MGQSASQAVEKKNSADSRNSNLHHTHNTENNKSTNDTSKTRKSISNDQPKPTVFTHNGLEITCYIGDVTRAESEGIVTGEGCGMGAPSMVTKAICLLGKIDYSDMRTFVTDKYGTANLVSGETYCLETAQCNIHLKFKAIFVAIVLQFNDAMTNNDWKSHMTLLYMKLLEKADREGIASLAVPLLGSGDAGAPLELAVEALVQSLSQYKGKPLLKVMLVSFDVTTHDEVIKQCKKLFSTYCIQKSTSLHGYTLKEYRVNDDSSENAEDMLDVEAFQDNLKQHEVFLSTEPKKQDDDQMKKETAQTFQSKYNELPLPRITYNDMSLPTYKRKESLQPLNNMKEFEFELFNDTRQETADSGDLENMASSLNVYRQRRFGSFSYRSSSKFCSPSVVKCKEPTTKYELQNGLMFEVRLQDILKVEAEVIVTGESSDFNGISLVTQQICKQGGLKHQEWKEALLKNHERLKNGKVYEMKMESSFPFRYSFSAIMHGYQSGNDSRWIKFMNEIYSNIVRKAEDVSVGSIVIPLLGSGRAGAPVELAISVALKSLSATSRDHLHTVYLALVDPTIFEKVQEECEKFKICMKTSSVPKEAWVSHHREGIRDLGFRSEIINLAVESNKQPKRRTVQLADLTAALDEIETGVVFGSFAQEAARYIEPMKKRSTSFGPRAELCLQSSFVPKQHYIQNKSSQASKDITNVTKPYPLKYEDTGKLKQTDVKQTTIWSPDVIDICVICIDSITQPKKLDKCGHVFCKECIDKCFKVFKPVCPICNTIYDVIIGTQPSGQMTFKRESKCSLPGHPNCGTITITYRFEDGIQGQEHPKPGSKYYGTTRIAFLPDSTEGNKVLRLLMIAFKRRVTFVIGKSLTTGMVDVITWNDIHHKTNKGGDSRGFGYPDPTYLYRVMQELAFKGITEADLSD